MLVWNSHWHLTLLIELFFTCPVIQIMNISNKLFSWFVLEKTLCLKVFEWTFKICKHEVWINCRKVSDSLIDRLSMLSRTLTCSILGFFTLKSDISLKICSPCSVDLLPFTSKKTMGLQQWIMGYYGQELGTVESFWLTVNRES